MPIVALLPALVLAPRLFGCLFEEAEETSVGMLFGDGVVSGKGLRRVALDGETG
jgi:hypothetical protein